MKHSRTFWVGLLASICCGVVHADGTPARFKLNIEPQPLGSALMAFGEQSGVQVLMKIEDGAVEKAKAPRLVGEFTAQGALDQMLRNSGLRYEFVNDRTVRVSSAEETADVPVMTSWKVAQARGSSPAAGASGSGQSAEAQESDREPAQNSTGAKLEEIVVTAQKREERLIDVPITITALSGKNLEENRIVGLQDLAKQVPGLSFNQYAPGFSTLIIRGIGVVSGNSPTTGIYLDEVPMTISGHHARTPDISTQDLQRVEVLKGPQGTLFGEAAMGGTIRYVTNDPVLDRFEGSVNSSYFTTHQGADSHEFNGVLNLPLVENVFGIRAAANYSDFGGWIDKVTGPDGTVLKKDANENLIRNLRVKALWKPSAALTVSAMILSQRNDLAGPNYFNVDSADQSHLQQAFGPNLDDTTASKYDIQNLTVTYDLGFATLLSSTSHYDFSMVAARSMIYPAKSFFAEIVGLPDTGNPVSIEIRSDGGTEETSTWAQELRLTSSDSGPFKWTVGGYYKDAETVIGGDFSHVKIAGLPWFEDGPQELNLISIDGWAAFADGSFEVTDRLEIGGGARHASEERFARPLDGTATAPLVLSYDKVTYRAFASYKLNDRFRIYANTGTGFRAGGINSSSSIALGAPPFFGPETTTNYEIGVKGSLLDGRLSGALALYRIDWTDIQGGTLQVINNVPVGYTNNTGAARVNGLELELDWQATRNWRLGLRGGITDARYTKIDLTITNPPVLEGDWTFNTPEYTFALSSDYRFDWSDAIGGSFHVDYNQQGHGRMTSRNAVPVEEVNISPVVGFWNARVDTMWKNWTFSIFGQNLLDETKPIQASVQSIFIQNRRRTLGLTVGKSF